MVPWTMTMVDVVNSNTATLPAKRTQENKILIFRKATPPSTNRENSKQSTIPSGVGISLSFVFWITPKHVSHLSLWSKLGFLVPTQGSCALLFVIGPYTKFIYHGALVKDGCIVSRSQSTVQNKLKCHFTKTSHVIGLSLDGDDDEKFVH